MQICWIIPLTNHSWSAEALYRCVSIIILSSGVIVGGFSVLTGFSRTQAAVVFSLVRLCRLWLRNAAVNMFFTGCNRHTALAWIRNVLCYLSCHGRFFWHRWWCLARPSGHLHPLFIPLAEDVVGLVRKGDVAEVHSTELLNCHRRERARQGSEEGWGVGVAATGWFGSRGRAGFRCGIWIRKGVWLRVGCRTRSGVRKDDREGNLQGQPVGASPGRGGAGLGTQLPAQRVGAGDDGCLHRRSGGGTGRGGGCWGRGGWMTWWSTDPDGGAGQAFDRRTGCRVRPEEGYAALRGLRLHLVLPHNNDGGSPALAKVSRPPPLMGTRGHARGGDCWERALSGLQAVCCDTSWSLSGPAAAALRSEDHVIRIRHCFTHLATIGMGRASSGTLIHLCSSGLVSMNNPVKRSMLKVWGGPGRGSGCFQFWKEEQETPFSTSHRKFHKHVFSQLILLVVRILKGCCRTTENHLFEFEKAIITHCIKLYK